MFCKECGTQIPEGATFCPKCGADVKKMAGESQSNTTSSFNQSQQSYNQSGAGQQNYGNATYRPTIPLKTDRSGIAIVLLTLITCGIYYLYFIHKTSKDVNATCDGDHQNTAGLGMYIFLSIITCGIYTIYWVYKFGNRLQDNASRYNITISENGNTLLMYWLISYVAAILPAFAINVYNAVALGVVSYIISVICAFMTASIMAKNLNLICAAYNRVNNL